MAARIEKLVCIFAVSFAAVLIAPTLELAAGVEQQQAQAQSTSRIAKVDDPAFGENARRITFEKTPGGELLKKGDDIGKAFVDWGCVLETSFKQSFVSIDDYNVGGTSAGNCAANDEPRFQGTITVRFCKPGEAETKATVHAVGFWVSHVAVDGTVLLAYDADEKPIAEVKVTHDHRDFLGIKSERPIAYVKIVPNPEIDPDFAFDDLTFDRPQAIK